MLTMDSGNPLRLPAERVGEFIDRQDEIRTFKDSIYLNPKRIQEIAKISGDPFYIPRIAGKGNVVKYRVRQGDVLGSIASRYHVTVQQLRAWNGISGSKIRIGQTLLIYTGKNS